MRGQIAAVKRSKSGLTLGVKFENYDQWYTTKAWELENAIGKSIDFDPSEQLFTGGGSCWWLNDYTWADGAAPPPPVHAPPPGPPTPPVSAYQDSQTAAAPQTAPVTSQRDPTIYLPFVSNTVAHAIQAGLVKSPADIQGWATLAFEAAKVLVEGSGDPY